MTNEELAKLSMTVAAVRPVVMETKTFPVVMSYLQRFVEIGGVVAEVHPYAKTVWGLITIGYRVLQTQYDQDNKVKDLWDTVCTTIEFLNEAEPLQFVKHLSGTIQAIMEQLHACIVYLTQVKARTKAEAAFAAVFSAESDLTLRKFSDSFADLKIQLDQRINLNQWKVIQHTQSQINSLSIQVNEAVKNSENAELRHLPGFNLGGIQGNSFCLVGTRTKILDDMLDWVVSDSGTSMLWLSGPAGTGKSSIAASFALQLESMHWLGAFFRFRRDSAEEITPCHLFGSIAYQLAMISDDLHAHILAATKKSAHITLLQKQAQDFVVTPLQNSIIAQPLVIVIDALDESAQEADKNGMPGRRSLVQTIVAAFATLPNQ
ncbi:hypothetical protein C0995_008710, partial [Termitomyces sp. Mi166